MNWREKAERLGIKVATPEEWGLAGSSVVSFYGPPTPSGDKETREGEEEGRRSEPQ